MFLRKVHRDFPNSVIKDIMYKDFNHKYELLHNQAKQKNKNSYTNTLIFIGCILLVGFFYSTSTNDLTQTFIYE